MQVHVYNLYEDSSTVIEGSVPSVEAELLRLFPWLRSDQPEHHGDVRALIDHLNASQAYEAEVLDHGEEPIQKAEAGNLQREGENEVVAAMLGYHDKLLRALDAAKFLCGGATVSGEKVRRALWEADGDPEESALGAYGLEATESNLRALRAVQDMSQVAKSDEPAQAQDVQAGHPDADDVADAVRRAFQDEFVMPVKLGGKHSAGSLLARDQDTGAVWLLKPGSGGQTPAAGAKQDPSSQSRREAAFWHMADTWHLGDFLPRADLVLVDGREYAAIHLLPWSYKLLDKLKNQDPGIARRQLDSYRNSGVLHRWAILDFVLGNPDRHANNLMIHGDDVKLIDHGSAMAGPAFDPAHDQYSFVPYYLRAWAPTKFSKLSADEKLKYMPRVGRHAEEGLRGWLDSIHAEDLDRVLHRYGVDPEPAKARLAKLKAMATQGPVDLAINQLWVTT